MLRVKNLVKKLFPPSRHYFNRRIESVDRQIEGVRYRIESLEQQMEAFDKKRISIDKSLGIIESQLKENNHTLESFIAKLHKEIELIRQEIDVVKIETKRTDARNNRLNRPNLSIKKQLWSLAGAQTAEYVALNMPKTKIFKDQTELRAYAVSKAKDGLYLEFGVYSGKSINEIAEAKPGLPVYGFDSFEGLPETWRAGFEEGKFSKDQLPAVRENVTLIKGWFKDTLPLFIKEHLERCAFIHMDCDLYSSAKTVLKYLNNHIVKDTIILFDEYFNYPSWQEHEFKAFKEFVTENNIEYEYIGFVEAYEQAAVRIKSRG